jgi:nucleotide-binding universal stress UspA family protein
MGIVAFDKTLIAVDASPLAAHAASVGMDLARALGAQAALISVVDPAMANAIASDVSPNELLAEARSDARLTMDKLRPVTSANPPLEFRPEGDPGDEIIKAAKDWPADMIVIGSHGRHGLDRVLLGSVAEAVMRRALSSPRHSRQELSDVRHVRFKSRAGRGRLGPGCGSLSAPSSRRPQELRPF